MWHHQGMRAVERMLLDGTLPPRALLAFWAIAARVHPLTGKAWAAGDELSAVYGMHPENFGRHLSALKKLGLLVRRKEKPDRKLEPWERRFLPDPSTRGPHSGRLFFQLHPLLVSVGSRSKRERALDEFREAIGNRVTPFEEVLAAIKAEDEAAELARTSRGRPGARQPRRHGHPGRRLSTTPANWGRDPCRPGRLGICGGILPWGSQPEIEQDVGGPPAGPGSLDTCITDVEDREDAISRRRQRLADFEGLNGWFMTTLADGRGPDGKPLHWMIYEHLDGREASVMGGRSTDPELQALLDARGGKAAGSTPMSRGLLTSAVFALARRLFRSRK